MMTTEQLEDQNNPSCTIKWSTPNKNTLSLKDMEEVAWTNRLLGMTDCVIFWLKIC